jgi:sugar lactone lactonase YvrE
MVEGGDKPITLLDVASGEVRARLGGHLCWVTHLAFSPCGNTLLTADSPNQTVKLWDVATGEERPFERVWWLDYYEEWLSRVGFSADGGTLALKGERRVGLWDAASARHLATVGGVFGPVGLDKQGRLVLLLDGGGRLRVLTLAPAVVNGAALATFALLFLPAARGLRSLHRRFASVAGSREARVGDSAG